MAKIRPFKAIRPSEDKVHLVASRSYVTYSESQLRDKLEHNPYTFIHVINPDYDAPTPSAPATQERFLKIKDKLADFIEKDVLLKDEKPAFYVYRQRKADLDCIGIIGGVDVEDYHSGHIRIHEQTIARREALFADYLDTTGFNAEPILLCHEDIPELNAFYQEVMHRKPLYHFSTVDTLEHEVWGITDQEEIAQIEKYFAQLKGMYIADGHHRSASSALLADKKKADPSQDDDHPSGYMMCYMIPASGLVIHGYHRLVRDLGDLSSEDFLNALREKTTLTKLDHKDQLPKVGTIDLYIDKEWYRMDFSPEVHLELPDAEWLTREVLSPILQIGDLRNDARIRFEPETTGLETIAGMVDDGRYACAFILHPVPFDQLKTISDLGQTMPPKSTWIEPKLRSGLTIYSLEKE